MTYRVAINGFGRIGRNVLRAGLHRGLLEDGVEIVAVNDLWPVPALAELLRWDSTFGRPPAEVDVVDGGLSVAGHRIPVSAERDPARLPWTELDVDLVIESTGRFRTRAAAAAHLQAGADKVLISAPGKGVDATVVLGVSDDLGVDPRCEIVSAASCTTNCVAPMIDVLHRGFGVRHGFLTTVHAYTNDQSLLDGPHKDPRRARSAAVNMIPTSTGAAKAVGEVIPALAGRLGGVAVRVPVENGSITDLTVQLERDVSVREVNEAFEQAAHLRLSGILRCSHDPLVSRDVIGDSVSCIVDSALTQVDGDLVKVFGWYDNEWGYTNRLLDLVEIYADVLDEPRLGTETEPLETAEAPEAPEAEAAAQS
ncbi:type I glyceraldehyde-3-phosphate dehydrogenase [Spongisporangium articulatum]|uniref:Type I glyceraldehyde-3-phosphate dehydrogenase n=1 Tax=Spongisporangium articulatum TaxID=3362603 RepID=A0ABW8AM31_9ACTN